MIVIVMLRSILTQVFFYPSGMYFITLRNVLYKPSRGVAIFSISMVLVSTLTFVLSTLEVLQVSHSHPPSQPHPLSPPSYICTYIVSVNYVVVVFLGLHI